MSGPKNAAPSRSHLTSLMYSLPVRRLKDILSHVVPDASLGAVEQVESTQLPRLYNLNMSDDQKLLLSFAPSLAVRLLRQEATILSSEATLIYFISASTRGLKIDESSSSSTSEIPNAALRDLVPKILKHSSNNREMAYPYSIFEPTAGAPLSTLSIYLSIPDRHAVDKQVGSMVRELSFLTSPTGTFGTVSRVLPDPSNGAPPTNPPIAGSSTWSEAFNTLLEGILRDGEDMTVLLPYETIRGHYQRLSFHLDTVTLPRLVVLDASSETNIMVERIAEEPSSGSSSTSTKFTGLRSWSQGVFGDPLLCEAFEDPSEGFLEGWKEGGGEDEIGEEGNLEIRSLFYRCYRASVGIVTQYYRPQADSSRRELEARRKLTNVLAELARVETAEASLLKRPRSQSGEAESAKRLKS